MRLKVLRDAGRKALCCGLSLVVAAGVAVPMAFADSNDSLLVSVPSGVLASQSSATTQSAISWQVPTSAVSAAKIASDNVLTVGSHGSATALPEMLGLNGTVWPTKQFNPDSLAAARTNNRLGVYGSAANQSPNPYLSNLMYNFYAASTHAKESDAIPALDTSSNAEEGMFNSAIEEAYGTTSDLALRPDIVMGLGGAVGTVSGISMNRAKTTSQFCYTWGTGNTMPTQAYAYPLVIRTWTNDASLAGTRNSDDNTYVLSEHYRDGDNDYDPIGVKYNGNTNLSGYQYFVQDADALVRAARLAIQADSGKTSRYANGDAVGSLKSIAAKYEQYVLGTKWYVLSKLGDGTSGTVAKKTVAIVADVTASGNFVLVKMNADGSDANMGTLRMVEAVQDTVTDLAEEALPNAADGSYSVTRNAVGPDTLAKADVVFTLPFSPLNESLTGQDIANALKKAGKSESDSDWPLIVDSSIPVGTYNVDDSETGFVSSIESGLLVGYAQGLIYPELVNPVDMMTYYASELFHLTDSSLEAFVKDQLADATLPSGVSLDTARYTKDRIMSVQSILDAGTSYYYAKGNKASIDAKRPLVTSTDALDDANGYGVTDVTISKPSKAKLAVYDQYGIEIPANANGTYTLDDDDQSVVIVSLAGYRDYARVYRGTDKKITITEKDLTPAKKVSFTIPSGAVLVVRDASGSVVKPDADGMYALDADKVATYVVSLGGYQDYSGTIAAKATSVTVKKSSMSRETVATTIVVPSKAKLSVKSSAGKTVAASSDGTYALETGVSYTLTVKLSGYDPYTKKVIGGNFDKVTIYKASLTKHVAQTTLTINKATVNADDVELDASTVKTITLGSKVKKVSASAFAKCAKLTKVTGGANVTSIGATAFKGCSKLTSVAFGSKLTTIGKSAFAGAKKLTTLTVKSKKLTKKGVKGSLAGSSVKTVKVSVGNASANKAYVAKYKPYFAKSNSGKSVSVK